MKKALFVLTEHLDGLSPGRLARYGRAQARIAAITGVDVEAVPYEEVEAPDADALVLSGSFDPWAMHDASALERFHDELVRYSGPVLGICAGMQILVRARGGEVSAAERPTRGFEAIHVLDDSDLFAGLPPRFDAFQSHTDQISLLPEDFRVLASSETCPIEAIAAVDRPWWGTQFHPEEWDDGHPAGRAILERFAELAGRSQTQ